MKFLLYIQFIAITLCVQAQFSDQGKVSLSVENSTIQDVLELLSKKYELSFSYQSNLKELMLKKSISFTNQPFPEAMESILTNSGLSYKFFAGQVIIFPSRPMISNKILIEGKLYKSGTNEPVSFVGLELKNTRKGTISDLHGYFRMELDGKHVNDTLLVRSLNFIPILIPVRNLTVHGSHIFYLVEKKYDLPGLDIIGKKSKFEIWGNHKRIQSGSFYLDTHGQQTAIFLPNEERKEASLVSVNFYLSKKGNTDAPFRVHIYLADSITGKPVTDQLLDIVIIKPNKLKGWYNVNLARYKIKVPYNGIFVAIEGIFPGDFNFSYSSDSENSDDDNNLEIDDFEGETISYGQQIGYTGGLNNTWHYSIEGNWFQIKKKRFNAMIYAEIKLNNTKNDHHFLGLFKKRVEQISN